MDDAEPNGAYYDDSISCSIVFQTTYIIENVFSNLTHQLLFDFLERRPFCFRNKKLHPKKLEDHHEAEKPKDDASRKSLYHGREKESEQSGKHPVCTTAQSLSLGPMKVREDFRNKHPNNSALPYSVGGYESENANWNDGEILRRECP